MLCKDSFSIPIMCQGKRRKGGEGPVEELSPASALVVIAIFSDSCSIWWWVGEKATHQSPLLEAIPFVFIEEKGHKAPLIDSLWATISILCLDVCTPYNNRHLRPQGLPRSHSVW